MARTEEEIQADIDLLLQSRMDIATGKSVEELSIGTGDSSRSYTYREIDLNLIE